MATIASTRAEKSGDRSAATNRSLVIADANWFTTENLFRELDRDDTNTLLLGCLDYRNAWRRGDRPWSGWGGPTRRLGPRLWKRSLAMPPGWMKRFPEIGMRPIRSAIRQWRRSRNDDGPIDLVMTYPHYLALRDLVRPDRSVYFNVDDYTLCWPGHAEAIRALERRAVRESDLTVCVSRLRCDELRAIEPDFAHKIRHLPHGAPASSVPIEPQLIPASLPVDIAHFPRPILGYVGSLEDRVDWPLIDRLALAFPEASIVLVGRVPMDGSGAWFEAMNRALERPNVHAIGWRPQSAISGYNLAFDVALIPYDVAHPFNIACCPTKIMDTMGSGRPIVSTDLPECRLYRDLFDVPTDADGFIDAVSANLERDDARAIRRHQFAVEETCEKMADRLIGWLDESGVAPGVAPSAPLS